ncbi:MAG: type II toxin-antitoxin system prevent-host-death family antitoxin [Bifidobacteriaceae bacterium]|jgi:prevent-host-death family protein|nr:type II toxin-antitoxin system prevent-host-death family antitoxin [Bifidobacteriaceae bacterium]
MTTISQRELRNDSGQILRQTEQGQEFTITRRGTPVARIVPYQDEATGARPARRPALFSESELRPSEVPSEHILDELRQDR